MLRLVALLAIAVVAAAQPPKADEVLTLVEKLGSGEFTDREDATRRLEALGPAALDELRRACKSENPETARRAQDLVRKIERKVANEKTLAPTLVAIDVIDAPLDAVLAELSKQAKCEVVLGGVKPEELAGKKVAVSTGGQVPFWTAMLKVCDAAGLQINSAGGFLAPGASPYLGRRPTIKGAVRVAANPQQAVVLVARTAGRRPAAVYGAVLVEALPVPQSAATDSPAALLQVWPEPRLRWDATTGVKVAKATDAGGVKLVADTTAPPPAPPFKVSGDGVVIIRNPDGSARVVRSDSSRPDAGFTPHARQSLLKFKPAGKSPEAVKELEVKLVGKVFAGVEPLSRATGLVLNQTATGVGVSDVDLSVTIRKDTKGKLVASVNVAYDSAAGFPATLNDELPGVKAGVAGYNYTIHGVRITDADGEPYTLGLLSGANQFDPVRRCSVMRMQLELHPDKDGQGPPDAATFWGTHARPVEATVTLKDVPLGGGK